MKRIGVCSVVFAAGVAATTAAFGQFAETLEHRDQIMEKQVHQILAQIEQRRPKLIRMKEQANRSPQDQALGLATGGKDLLLLIEPMVEIESGVSQPVLDDLLARFLKAFVAKGAQGLDILTDAGVRHRGKDIDDDGTLTSDEKKRRTDALLQKRGNYDVKIWGKVQLEAERLSLHFTGYNRHGELVVQTSRQDFPRSGPTHAALSLKTALRQAAHALVEGAAPLKTVLIGSIRFHDCDTQTPFGNYVRHRLDHELREADRRLISGEKLSVELLRGDVRSPAAPEDAVKTLTGTYWGHPDFVTLRLKLLDVASVGTTWWRDIRRAGLEHWRFLSGECVVGTYSLRPGETFKDCADCPEMVVVPSGSFMMGSPDNEEGRYDDEGPRHRVTIPAPFAVGRFEVTFSEWDACVSDGGCDGYRPEDEGWGRDRRPVISVNWNDAQRYVSWLSQKTGHVYRLLSEAEWEYVARAGTTTRYHWGDDYRSDRVADGAKTEPVGRYASNRFGLHDVHGNVFEWVEDCWNGSYAEAPADGRAWVSGDCSVRVVRGGSWLRNPRSLRAAYRIGSRAEDPYRYGFRVVRTL